MIDLNTTMPIESGPITEAGTADGTLKRGIGGTMADIIKASKAKVDSNKVRKAVKQGSSKVSEFEDNLNRDKVLDRRSIVARASNSVMQFPIYITQSNRIAEGHALGKTFEKVYASFVQNVIAQNPVITDISKVNGLKFLRDYHSNIKESSELTIEEFRSIFNEYCEPIDQFDEILTEAVINELKLPGGTVTFMLCRPNPLIVTESQRLSHESLEGLRYLSEAGGTPGASKQKQEVTDRNTSSKEVEITDLTFAVNYTQYLKDLGLAEQAKEKKWSKEDSIKAIKAAIEGRGITRTSDGRLLTYKDGKYFVSVSAKRSSETVTKNDAMKPAVEAPALIRDLDVRKFNGMQPYQFVVKFRVNPVYTKDGDVQAGTNYEQNYILGVKTILHVIKVKDLSDDLKEIITGDRKGLQKVRYKTGEISWLKDYMLNLPGLKADAAKNLDDRRWLSTLKRLGEYEHLHGTALKKPVNAIYDSGVPIPNATLIVTRGDVERMKDETGIDIEAISTARTLAKRLFLIAVVIVDQTAGSFKVFFPDMDNDWDVQSLGALDAEIARIDNSPLMNEINRISRKG